MTDFKPTQSQRFIEDLTRQMGQQLHQAAHIYRSIMDKGDTPLSLLFASAETALMAAAGYEAALRAEKLSPDDLVNMAKEEGSVGPNGELILEMWPGQADILVIALVIAFRTQRAALSRKTYTEGGSSDLPLAATWAKEILGGLPDHLEIYLTADQDDYGLANRETQGNA